ncbi:hypothetical protein J2S17_004620 [Cytobacillus purgationiresistens]|uniref:Uncharacterized protein n=1 Tax=Cytobacillus purgationiresistens TaxID=863449 RepID=A0ABU0AN64_9BACI|nr:hypothetical protein [Cytobacillus purgationiresistens]
MERWICENNDDEQERAVVEGNVFSSPTAFVPRQNLPNTFPVPQ